MAALARAERGELQAARDAWEDMPQAEAVRGPEIGLVMIRGRIGGGGAPFNLGEATATRATMRLETGEIGHACVLGRDRDRARLAALFDALWQSAPRRVEREVIAPIRARLDAEDATVRRQTAATRVDFFTLVRGEDP